MKKGFVFLETIAVLTVVAIATSMLLVNYTVIMKRVDINTYYDNSSDIYALYTFMNIGTTLKDNYITYESNFFTRRDNCSSSDINKYISSCDNVMKKYDLLYAGVIKNISNEVKNNYSRYQSGTINYLEYISDKEKDNNKTYAVGVFYRNGKYYYASIEME